MTIHRTSKTGNFTISDNGFSCDQNLDWDAKGLLIYLLTKPDHWRINKTNLINAVDGAGETRVESILKKLESAGYLIRWRFRNSKGQIIHDCEILESFRQYENVRNALIESNSGNKTFQITTPQLGQCGSIGGKKTAKSQKPFGTRKINNVEILHQELTPLVPATHGEHRGGLTAPLVNTDSEVSTKEVSTERELIKENDFFQKSPLSVENDFLGEPSASDVEALMQATLNPTNSEAAEAELAELRPHLSSTLATSEKTSVPPRENGSQIIKTAADVKPAIAAKKRRAALAVDRAAQYNPDAAEAWWGMFRTQAHQADCKPGVKSEAIAAWDLLHKIEPEGTKATLYERIIQGTEVYWEREAARQNPNCKHGVRFLEKRDWEEALQWAEVKSSSNGQSAQRFAPFLTCWNQDRPMTWPTADESDLSPKSTGRLEELIASCANSLERFQKALHWAKRDPYWGLQRSQSLEEFLYSGQINNFYKKQVHAESIGMDKVVAPDRKAVEAASKMAASKRESVARYLEEYRRGELTLSEVQTILTSIGVDPASVLEAC